MEVMRGRNRAAAHLKQFRRLVSLLHPQVSVFRQTILSKTISEIYAIEKLQCVTEKKSEVASS